jgi:hypothetical protein
MRVASPNDFIMRIASFKGFIMHIASITDLIMRVTSPKILSCVLRHLRFHHRYVIITMPRHFSAVVGDVGSFKNSF